MRKNTKTAVDRMANFKDFMARFKLFKDKKATHGINDAHILWLKIKKVVGRLPHHLPKCGYQLGYET